MKRAGVAAGLSLLLLAGCSTVGYYAQSVGGHLAMVNAARPVAEVIADPATEPALKERLALTQRMRDFAVREVGLPDNASYRRYADVGRPFAVWNVVAAPELSLRLEQWCFPVVGCVAYRGYFDRAEAEAFAATLRAQGLEVSVYGVPAYSTLGKLPRLDWLADPLLNTFVRWNEGELARLVFHELAHQVAFAEGDTVFNESYATAVERIGGRLWLERHASEAVRAEQRVIEQRREGFRRLAFAARAELAAIYASDRSAEDKRAEKAAAMARLRAAYETVKREQWGGFSGYDPWFARTNNAALGVLAAYNAQVPAFEALYAREGRDFARFHAAVKALAAAPKNERDAALAALAPKGD